MTATENEFGAMVDAEPCPLCDSQNSVFYHQDKKRSYVQCTHCDLVFVPQHFHLTQAQEKAEYDKHQNDVADEGYLRFLSRMSKPVIEMLPQGGRGLDFGCGPAPALANVLTQNGFDMSLYDLYYHPNSAVLAAQYDIITSTEVVEHLSQPGKVINELVALLKPQGTLAIMTKRVLNRERFKTWHYKNDPTHICFFSENSFQFIANKWQLSLRLVDQDVVFLTKG